jgi:hypothetical protein
MGGKHYRKCIFCNKRYLWNYCFNFNWSKYFLEKPVSYYCDAFEQSNKREILLKHIFSHQFELYRSKKKIDQQDLLDWDKIINILEN